MIGRQETASFVALLAGLLWLGCDPAMAQLAPGNSGYSTTMSYSGSVAWRELGTFGKCYAARNKDRALALIATEPGTKTELDVYKAMFHSQNQSCLGSISDMRMPHNMVRGTIAEGLYKQRVPVPTNLVLSAPASGEAIVNLTGAARCYVAGHAQEVQSLVSTTWPGSPEETAGIQRLMPDFDKCVRSNANVRLNSTQLRFWLAEVLYRMSGPQAGQMVGAN